MAKPDLGSNSELRKISSSFAIVADCSPSTGDEERERCDQTDRPDQGPDRRAISNVTNNESDSGENKDDSQRIHPILGCPGLNRGQHRSRKN
jgi:hypothetical protein